MNTNGHASSDSRSSSCWGSPHIPVFALPTPTPTNSNGRQHRTVQTAAEPARPSRPRFPANPSQTTTTVPARPQSTVSSPVSGVVGPQHWPDGRAKRPGMGTLGNPIKVITNYFRLDIHKAPIVYQYDVKISSSKGAGAPPALFPAVPAPAATPSNSAPGKTSQPKQREVLGEEARAVVQQLSISGGWQDAWVYDNAATLYSTRSGLQAQSGAVQASPPGGAASKQYQVTLQATATLDVPAQLRAFQANPESSAEASLAVMQLVSRSAAAADPDTVASPRGYVSYKTPLALPSYRPPLHKVLGGFRASVQAASKGLLLSVDTTQAVVLSDGPLLDVLKDAAQARDMADLERQLRNDGTRKRLSEGIKQAKVRLQYGGKAGATITSIDKRSAKDWTFKDDSGKETTVAKYYKAKYGITLAYPDLPCARNAKGSAFPLELCMVEKAQRRNQMQDARLQAAIIRAAALKPEVKLQRIKELLSKALNLGSKVPKAFGLLLAGQNPLMVDARVLPGPNLQYPGTTVQPGNEGAWRPPRSSTMSQGVTCNCAAMLIWPSPPPAGLQQFSPTLKMACKEAGSPLPASIPAELAPKGATPSEVPGLLDAAVKAAMQKGGLRPQLILVVLPDDAGLAKAVREEVKAHGDGTLGIPTQCINPAKAYITVPPPRPDSQRLYCSNLALKIGSKLGGVATRLAISSGTASASGVSADVWRSALAGKSFMVLGADVSRAPNSTGEVQVAGEVQPAGAGGKRESLSFAGVVGSFDASATRYHCSMLAQLNKDDLVVGMDIAIAELLRKYKAENKGKLPEVLVMFRDGVSEGLMDLLLATEQPQIKEACAAVGGSSYQPKLTFVVVQKGQSNFRMFPGPNSPVHRSGNVMPGTVVDDLAVMHPHYNDFILNSHAGIQGTNKPPRYMALVDELAFSADALQSFIWHYCHTYSSCTRTLSVPPSARYADQAAERAREILTPAQRRELNSIANTGAVSNGWMGGRTSNGSFLLMPTKHTAGGAMFYV